MSQATHTPAPTPATSGSGSLVFLHGFTQNHHHQVDLAMQVSSRTGWRPVTLVDLPGHGLSGDDRGTITDAATQAVALGGRGDYIGYSMGGRTALHCALIAPDQVQRLVLIGATAGIADETARAERRTADEQLADRVEAIGVDAFIDEWLAAPMWANLPNNPDDRIYRRQNTVAGLAHSLRTAGTGAQESLWDRLPEITQPVLIIAGSQDTKFTEIGHQLAAALPHADLVQVPGAGHATHLEQPATTADLIADWLTTGSL